MTGARKRGVPNEELLLALVLHFLRSLFSFLRGKASKQKLFVHVAIAAPRSFFTGTTQLDGARCLCTCHPLLGQCVASWQARFSENRLAEAAGRSSYPPPASLIRNGWPCGCREDVQLWADAGLKI